MSIETQCTCPDFNSFGHEPGCPFLNSLTAARKRESETPTPRTEQFADILDSSSIPSTRYWPHWFDFARTLERELTAAKQRIAELEAGLRICDQNAIKILQIKWGYDSDCGAIALADAITEATEAASIGAPQPKAAPTPLDRPDAPGWWWNWNTHRKEWRCWLVSKPDFENVGIWLPANPPAEPVREGGE